MKKTLGVGNATFPLLPLCELISLGVEGGVPITGLMISVPNPTFYKFIYFYFIFYLFLAVLGLRCCVWALSSCGERGLPFVAVHGLLIAVASLCCGAWALGTRASVVAARGLQ